MLKLVTTNILSVASAARTEDRYLQEKRAMEGTNWWLDKANQRFIEYLQHQWMADDMPKVPTTLSSLAWLRVHATLAILFFGVVIVKRQS